MQRDVEAVAHLLDRCFGPERESHLLASAPVRVTQQEQQQLPRLCRSPDERSGRLRDPQGTECPDRQVACTGSLVGRGDRRRLNGIGEPPAGLGRLSDQRPGGPSALRIAWSALNSRSAPSRSRWFNASTPCQNSANARSTLPGACARARPVASTKSRSAVAGSGVETPRNTSAYDRCHASFWSRNRATARPALRAT